MTFEEWSKKYSGAGVSASKGKDNSTSNGNGDAAFLAWKNKWSVESAKKSTARDTNTQQKTAPHSYNAGQARSGLTREVYDSRVRSNDARRAASQAPVGGTGQSAVKANTIINPITLNRGPISEDYASELLKGSSYSVDPVFYSRVSNGTKSYSNYNAGQKRSGESRDSFDSRVRNNYAAGEIARDYGAARDAWNKSEMELWSLPFDVSMEQKESVMKNHDLAWAAYQDAADKPRKSTAAAGGQKTDAGKLLGGMVLKGADQAVYGIASTLDWGNRLLTQAALGLTPEEYDSLETPTTQLKNAVKSSMTQNQEYFGPNANSSSAARIADTVGTGVFAAVPQAVLALMTAGASLEAQAGAAGLEAASAGSGLASTVGSAIQGMAKDPQYWLSFLQVAGQGYEDAKADGASELAASSYALINGLANAMVEVGGGGIQELPLKLNQGERKAALLWVENALDEGKEEAVQGVIERGLQNLVYAKNNPWFSVSDENAVFNPATSLKESAMGTAVGAILGGAEAGVNGTANRLADRVNTRRLTSGNHTETGITGPAGANFVTRTTREPTYRR